MKMVSHEAFLEALRAQGVPREHYAVTCIMCGTVQSGMSLIRAGAGTDFDAVGRYLGFSCVGRWTNGPSPSKAKEQGVACNWTLGGLFQTHQYEVVKEGKAYPHFEPATPEQARQLAEYNEVLGHVESRPVFKGDRLYVDIRGTCATQWGEPQVASMGVNEGQGPIIVFERGDYRMTHNLVWEPKES